MLCNFLVRMLKYFHIFQKKIFFGHKKFKTPPTKVAQKTSNPLFFLTAQTAQTAQTEEFMLQNVAYRPTVYRTGSISYLVCTDRKFLGIIYHNFCIADMVTLNKNKSANKTSCFDIEARALLA